MPCRAGRQAAATLSVYRLKGKHWQKWQMQRVASDREQCEPACVHIVVQCRVAGQWAPRVGIPCPLTSSLSPCPTAPASSLSSCPTAPASPLPSPMQDPWTPRRAGTRRSSSSSSPCRTSRRGGRGGGVCQYASRKRPLLPAPCSPCPLVGMQAPLLSLSLSLSLSHVSWLGRPRARALPAVMH